jgi:hypothetical protein
MVKSWVGVVNFINFGCQPPSSVRENKKFVHSELPRRVFILGLFWPDIPIQVKSWVGGVIFIHFGSSLRDLVFNDQIFYDDETEQK